MLLKIANRWQAFGVHVGISASVFLLLASIIYFWWYPKFLFLYDGGFEGMKLIAGVDFFIGPFLTFCIYKVGKKSLKFDLCCIALLQITCLGGGMWVVGKTRPIAVVYIAGSYATTNELGYRNAKYQVKQIDILDQTWPVWLAVDLPDSAEDAVMHVWAIMGENIQYNVEGYVPYAQKLDTLGKFGLQADNIKDSSLEMRIYQSRYPDLRFFPMLTSLYQGYVAVDVKNGEIKDFFKNE